MTIVFTDILPDDIHLAPVLISGTVSVDYAYQLYLVLYDAGMVTGLYEIKYQVRGGPFKEALLADHLLAAGYGEYFYLFNTITQEPILALLMDGYFGHLYYNGDRFYITDASGLHCMDKTGSICWANTTLGIDGVVINEFTEYQILGSGEFDPPDGWENFILDKQTGMTIR